MRRAGCILVLVFGCGWLWAQQEVAPAMQDGPMTVPAGKAQPGATQPGMAPGEVNAPRRLSPRNDEPAVADEHGVYTRGAGLTLPRFLDPVMVTYPGTAPVAEPPLNCVVSLVVGVDGAATDAKVVRSILPQVDERAMRDLLAAKYVPGTLDGKPVPMRVSVRLHFLLDEDTATPVLTWAGMGRGAGGERGPQINRKWDTPPKVIQHVEPEYSDRARRAKLQGQVTLSFVVTREGLPRDIQIERSLGMGLDEKAVQALQQYRFEPATKDGMAIDAPMNIEMSFRLY
jgi:TonB family protein